MRATVNDRPILRGCLGCKGVLIVALSVALLLASTFTAQPAHACTCSRPDAEEALQGTDAVFSGKVIGTLAGPTTFDVEEAWKGVSENQLTVDGRQSSDPNVISTCDFKFREGERYLVYAGRGEQGDDVPLQTSVCSRTKLLSKAEADLQALRSAALAFPEDAERVGADSPPTSGFWSDSAPIVAAASAMVLLLLVAGVVLTLWRKRRMG